jgi:hypothetical protein
MFEPFSTMAFHPDGGTLFLALGRAGLARLLIAPTEAPENPDYEMVIDGVVQAGQGANTVSISPNGRWLLINEQESSGAVSLWSSDMTHRELRVEQSDIDETSAAPNERAATVRDFVWSRDGGSVAWTSDHGVHLWQFQEPLSRLVDGSYRFVERYGERGRALDPMALSPSGRWLVASPRRPNGGMRLVDLDSEPLSESTLPGTDGPVVFLPGSDRFWVLGFHTQLWVPARRIMEESGQLPTFWVSEGAIGANGHRLAERLGSVLDLDDKGSTVLTP